jgi:FtsH-binding integral membrane protein
MEFKDIVLLVFVFLATMVFFSNERGRFGYRQKSVSALVGLGGLIAISIYQYPPERPFQLAGIVVLCLMAGMILGPILKIPSNNTQEEK